MNRVTRGIEIALVISSGKEKKSPKAREQEGEKELRLTASSAFSGFASIFVDFPNPTVGVD